ncbi:MAG: amidoligase family protein, partial [Nocardioides sp.]
DGDVVADAGPTGHRLWVELTADGRSVIGTLGSDGELVRLSPEELARIGEESGWSWVVPQVDVEMMPLPLPVGLELEASLPSPGILPLVTAEMSRLGLTTQDTLGTGHGTRSRGYSLGPDGWGVEREAIPSQIELVSPILTYDGRQVWDHVRTINGLLRIAGAEADSSSGLHVHVGTPGLATDDDKLRSLYAVIAYVQDTLYRLGTADPDTGHRGTDFTAPLSVPSAGIGQLDLDTEIYGSTRNRAINFEPLGKPRRVPAPPAPSALSPQGRMAWMLNPPGTGHALVHFAQSFDSHIEYRFPDAFLDTGATQALTRTLSHLTAQATADNPSPAIQHIIDWANNPHRTPYGLGHHAHHTQNLTPEEKTAYDHTIREEFITLLGNLDPPVADQIRALFDRGTWITHDSWQSEPDVAASALPKHGHAPPTSYSAGDPATLEMVRTGDLDPVAALEQWSVIDLTDTDSSLSTHLLSLTGLAVRARFDEAIDTGRDPDGNLFVLSGDERPGHWLSGDDGSVRTGLLSDLGDRIPVYRGEITLRFAVTDADGNTGTEFTRTVQETDGWKRLRLVSLEPPLVPGLAPKVIVRHPEFGSAHELGIDEFLPAGVVADQVRLLGVEFGSYPISWTVTERPGVTAIEFFEATPRAPLSTLWQFDTAGDNDAQAVLSVQGVPVDHRPLVALSDGLDTVPGSGLRTWNRGMLDTVRGIIDRIASRHPGPLTLLVPSSEGIAELGRHVRVPLLGWSLTDGDIGGGQGLLGSPWVEVTADGRLTVGTIDPDTGDLIPPDPERLRQLAETGPWSWEVPVVNLDEVEFPLPIGLEIEAVMPSVSLVSAVASQMADLGLGAEPTLRGLHETRDTGYSLDPAAWATEQESIPGKVELISPILTLDSPQTWRDVTAAHGLVRTLGGEASKQGGLHVHVGTPGLATDDDKLRSLYAVIAYVQDTLYRLGTADPDTGHRGTAMAEPLELPPGGVARLNTADLIHRTPRSRAVNFAPLAAARARRPALSPQGQLAWITSASSGGLAVAHVAEGLESHVEYRFPDAFLDTGATQALTRTLSHLTAQATTDNPSPAIQHIIDWANNPHRTPYGLGHHAHHTQNLTPEEKTTYDHTIREEFITLLGDLDP